MLEKPHINVKMIYYYCRIKVDPQKCHQKVLGFFIRGSRKAIYILIKLLILVIEKHRCILKI